MRLWSIHPKYLDAKGLVALWREGLLAQKVLKGETCGYTQHPQLHRFKSRRDPLAAIGRYLYYIHREALRRGYAFNANKIVNPLSRTRMAVTAGQIKYERRHYLSKLRARDRAFYLTMRRITHLDVHPLFRVVKGAIANWEVTK